MNNVKEKKKLNKVDVMIIILLMLCLAGVVLRVYVTASKPEEYTNPDEEFSRFRDSYDWIKCNTV